MKERTLRVLEFTRIREMLAEGALTEAGAEKCLSLAPADDLANAQALQEETEEAATSAATGMVFTVQAAMGVLNSARCTCGATKRVALTS